MFLSDTDKKGGRVQIINGDIYYSPNSCREITHIPSPDHHDVEGVTVNIFNPSGLSPDVSFFKLADYQNPRWWNMQFGWVAFTPRNPEFTGPVLAPLYRIPQARELDFVEGEGYGLPTEILHDWCGIEDDIKHMVMVLRKLTGPIVLPAYPEAFGYRARHKSRKTAIISFQRSRDWFVLWIAAMSYRIAIAESKKDARIDLPWIALADWYKHLVVTGCRESWLDGLTVSPMVRDFSSQTERAGTFVSLHKLQNDSRWPSVQWLCNFKIDVWYLWKLEWASMTKLASLAPLDYQLQSIATGSPSNRPISTQEADYTPLAAEPEQPREHKAKYLPTWHEWLAEREAANAQLSRVETKKRRDERLAREKYPGIKTARVFKWIPNDDDVRVRTIVHSQLNEDTLKSYERGHIRYDAFRNEWDCYEEMGPGGGYNDNDNDDSEDDDHIAQEAGFPYMDMGQRDEEEYIGNEEGWAHRGKTLQIDHEGVLEDPVTISEQEDPQGGSSDLEGYILEILRLRYGYTGLMPVRNDYPPMDIKAQKVFMKFIGLAWKEEHTNTFEKPNIRAANDFTLRLGTNGIIADDEWDLARSHRESVLLLPRFACIRRLTVNLGKDKSGNNKIKTWYMFDLGEKRTKPWMFTVTTASHALMICRLDKSYNDVDLACFCLSNGTPFKTMQLSTTLTRAPYSTDSTSTIISRGHGYSFIIDDFVTYEKRCTEFLTTNRRSRAACMMGGIPWRVAGDGDVHVKWSIVLNGPCGWSPNPQEFILAIEDVTNLEYMDDALTEAEIAKICGRYDCFTGNGMQIAKPSWYPHPDAFNGSGFDYGYWTELCEVHIRSWRWKATHPIATNSPDKPLRGPMNVIHWVSNLKGSSNMRKAGLRMTKLAEKIIGN
ncbi:hypothetical protein GALMADRAFT_136496 [Galerina marginata CBS 339.88]|uniref:Uncharacterized protein n=1 Tax=Galerina marginata (strain CBS 339.88) TaxID=685588 RepID=A0A067TJ39_GALM3|nr:hypothetical protein GALMADRAFT_136496 [Galerina marginata CBS 339.88]